MSRGVAGLHLTSAWLRGTVRRIAPGVGGFTPANALKGIDHGLRRQNPLVGL